jgi:TRAP-type mannitol/chloroaromatic compound transport system substrate-binding protein
MLTDKQFCENSQTVLILLAILQGITENTTSGDVIELSIYRAEDMCRAIGVSKDEFKEVVNRFVQFSKQVRGWNPLAF